MALFLDREHAGEMLTQLLEAFRGREDCLIIGLPRGGVVTAYVVAKELQLPLDIVCPRKVGAPNNPEFALGAVTATGEGYFDDEVIRRLAVPKAYLDKTIQQEIEEAKRRESVYRAGRGPLDVAGKTVIIVDDGIATGATVKAAVRSLRKQGAEAIIVAVPVIPPGTVAEIEQEADELVFLEAPENFYAVGQFYEEFSGTEDDEVIALLSQ